MTNQKSEKAKTAQAALAGAKSRVDSLAKTTELELELKKIEVGRLGRLFGQGKEKPGNIAGAAIGVAFIFVAIILFIDLPVKKFDPNNLLTVFVGSSRPSLNLETADSILSLQIFP